MPNFESAPKVNETAPSTGEATGETPREVSAERGRKTYETYKAERLKQINGRLAEIDAELAELRGDTTAEQDGVAPADEAEPTAKEETEESSEPAVGVAPVVGEGDGATAEQSQATAEQVQSTAERAKKNKNLRKILTGVTAGVLAAGILVGGIFIGRNTRNNSEQPVAPTETTAVTQTESAEVERGIYDGYGEKGMWLSEGKAGPYNFAKASEVAEVCENDECEMIKYTAKNQVESFADYLANLPEELQPEGFKGLSILETEAKLESLSPEDYGKTLEHFNGVMDEAFTRRVKINGRQNNAYMSLKDHGGDVKHGNMQLVKCVTNENNLEITEFYWPSKDGQEIGSMRVKLMPVYDADGSIVGFEGCEQVVTPDGENNKIYDELPEIPPDDPTPPGTTPDDPTPPGDQWGKSGDPHGGDLVTPSGPVNPATEVTKEQNDQTNTGNQGYVDDQKATPGSSSDSSGTTEAGFAGSGIIAPGADTDGGRLTGGEEQGGTEIAGENVYQDAEAIAAGQATDAAGNAAQAAAQTSTESGGEGLTPGVDNHSDTEEEARVAEGDF